MKNEKKLVKNTLILSIGTFFPKMVSIITIPMLTAGLSKEEYGTYDLITTMVALLLPILTLQIQSAAFRFLIECRGDKRKSSEIATNIFALTIPVSTISLILLYFILNYLSPSIRLLMCIYYFADILFLAAQQLIRGIGLNIHYSLSTVIVSVINLFTLLYFINYSKQGLLGVLYSLCISYVFAFLYLLFIINKKFEIKLKYISIKLIKEMLNYSWPMVPNNLSSWVLSLSDRLVISIFLGVEANAVYAVATKIPKLFSTIQGTFTLAWQENASEVSKEENASKYYSDMFDIIFRFMCGVMSMVIAFSPILFRLLIKGNYENAYVQLPLLFMGVLFSSISAFFGGIYVACKKTKSVGITTIIAAIINVLIDLFMVNIIGITAGSLSTVISYMFLSIYRMIDIKKEISIEYNKKCIIFYLCVLIVMSIIALNKKIIFIIINALLGSIVFLLMNRKMIYVFIEKINQKIFRK